MSTPPTWVLNRLLAFLNQAEQATDISASPFIQDDPATGKGYGIGEKVAHQIIAHRQRLPHGRFHSEADVLSVPGLGKDKFHDLLRSFFTPADEAFTQSLRDGILYNNWELFPQKVQFDSKEALVAACSNLDSLRQTIGRLAAPLHPRKSEDLQAAFRLRCRQAYVVSYPDAHVAAFQFAQWWYLFDQDNWFSFDRIRLACESYLNYHEQYPGLIYVQLMLYNESPLNESNWREIIPAVINHPERSITVWSAILND